MVTQEKNITVKHNITTIINDAAILGTIEGICVAVTKVSEEKQKDEVTTLINSLDAASRSLCPNLKLVSIVSKFNFQMCVYSTNVGNFFLKLQ